MRRFVLVVLVALLAGCAEKTSFSNAQPGLDVADAAMSGGSPDLALNVSNAMLAKDPGNVPALLSQGNALSALGRMPEAEASYGKVLAIAPGSVSAQIGLGRLRLRSDPAQAVSLFSGVLQREPRNKVALNNLGIAYDLQGNHMRAQNTYRQVLDLDPTMRATEVNLALSMALSGRASEAVRLLRPLASKPDAPRRIRHDLAAALAMTGDKQGAAEILGADLSPEQVERALVAYAALGS